MNDDPHGWSDLIDLGVLWYINTSIFHPMGFALSIVTDNDNRPVGWTILGDGDEGIYFDPATIDQKFAEFHNFIDSLRPE